MYPSYGFGAEEAESFRMFLGFFVGIMVFALAISVVMYVFQSAGVYAIAKRRGIRHAWLAWIPVANYWILGSISDQYQYVTKGKNTKNRVWLLCLYIVSMCFSIVGSIATLGSFFEAMQGLFAGDFYAYESAAVEMGTSLSSILMQLGSWLSVGMLVFWFICLHDLYRAAVPENATLYLLLSIFFGVAVPFLIFFNRKKDNGMQPAAPYYPMQ